MGNKNINPTYGKHRQEAGRISTLTTLWLEARISPEEERELKDFVRKADLDADGVSALFDRETLSTLRLLKAENLYSDRWLKDAAASMPEGLEEKMAAHIHSLADAEGPKRMPLFAKRILRYGSVAAAVALIAVAGWHFHSNSLSRLDSNENKTAMVKVPTKVIPNDTHTLPIESINKPDSRLAVADKAEASADRIPVTKKANQRRKKNINKSAEAPATHEEELSQYALSETDNPDYMSAEDLEKSIQLLEENLSMAFAYNTHINNKVASDLIIVDDMINRVEDDLEYVISSVGTLRRPALDVDDHIFISSSTKPNDPILF